MPDPASSQPCPACGTQAPAGARFCGACGSALGPRACRSCGAELSASARFCHRCGAVAGSTGATTSRSEKTAWTVAGVLVLALFAIIAWRVIAGRPAGAKAPDMANAGNAAPGLSADPGAGLPTGPAPDISKMSPQERFLRLNNRVMEAASRGDSATVVTFTPMALGAYAQLDTVTNDDRYHAAVLEAQIGQFPEALALTDTMLAATPGYLLAYTVRGEIAAFHRDSTAMRAAAAAFRRAWSAESATRRPEYADHANVLAAFRAQADSLLGPPR